MSDTYKLKYNGMTLTYPGWNGYVSYDAPAFKTLTLYNSEGGTLTANKLTGYPGDTINLSTAYDTYWRFSGYQLTGDGSLVGNDYTFGNEDASICACYKKNAFTATGGFDKGSNVTCTGANGDGASNYANIPLKYAIHGAHTGNVPASWYSTSNRWNPSNASAYKITLNPKMSVTGRRLTYGGKDGIAFTAVSLIGNTQTQSQNWSLIGSNTTSTQTWNYNKSFTSTTQSTYGISGRLRAIGSYNGAMGGYNIPTATYIANRTTGGWTATGYAP